MRLAPSLLLYVSLLLDCLPAADAVRMPIAGRRVPRIQDELERMDPGLGRRASMSGDLQDQGDVRYYTNVSLGGQQFSVLVDTGSSDLWVAGNVPGAKGTGKTLFCRSIMTANMQFDGTVVGVDSDHPVNSGVIGLGPNSASNIYEQFNNDAGDTPLNRIFEQNTSTPNFLSVLLAVRTTPTPNITSQPKLPILEDEDSGARHWQTLLDKDGIIGPDGEVISVQSVVQGLQQLVVVFDTGFSLPQVPTAVSNAIYSRVPGANYTNVPAASGKVWTLPCDVELNVTFKFGGISYPVSPLDTNLGALNVKGSDGNEVCVGAFQPITTAMSSTFDMILGMAFYLTCRHAIVRNAYLLVDLGDYVHGSAASTTDPYMQLLSITDPAEAHKNFVDARLGGVDNTSAFHLLPAMNTTNWATSSSESTSQKIKPYLPYIIAGSAAVAILLIVAAGACFGSRKRTRYQRLHEPAPVGLPVYDQPFPRYQRPHRRY
ncbi:aspartic peptidase domain-containing protein [Fomitopsis serialis]|uniref:aspartic peptidase domain-containing protein n=1 Tax=Fomitopsis serialis TaxID=139415 RepID=UPI002007F58F|nr:aspartic peptidase domain-containing protein [Neoantrodia serialis]KAH9935317.1 aspartic peptidase domain-containing protein [Neoantrodia serialis]